MLTLTGKIIFSSLFLGATGGIIATSIHFLSQNKNDLTKEEKNIDLEKKLNKEILTKNSLDIPKISSEKDNLLKNQDNQFNWLNDVKEQEIEKAKALLKEKEKWEEEILKRNISLEVIWKYGEDGKISGNSFCILIDSEDKWDTFLDLKGEISNDRNTCQKSYWSSYKLNEYNREGWWIRGKKNEVKRFISSDNWKNLQNSNFVIKDKKPKDFLNIFDWLNKQHCKTFIQNNDWVEVTCLENWALLDEINSEGYIKDTTN